MPLNLLLSLHDEVFEALIADFLVFCNYEVRAAYSQQDALSYCQNDNFDMAVIDIKEEKDAQFVEYLLAIKPELDILALIHEGVSNDVIKSLRLPQEQLLSLPAPLVSILEAIKVANESRQNEKLKSLTPVTIGSLCIDKQNATASVHGVPLTLTVTEFTLLDLLADNLNAPVSKDEIYPKVLGRPRGQFDRAIDVHISSVRHKLHQLHSDDICIESVRGVGYRLCKQD